jgi:hypothetical protein
MAKATMATRKEIIQRNKAAYTKAKKKEKGQILDHICISTGLSRDRVKRLIGRTAPKPVKKRKPGRKAKYDTAFTKTLEKVWFYMDFACGKRLVAGMGDMLEALITSGELTVSEEALTKLTCVSAATADRLLAKARNGLTLKGKSNTKPGTLLKRDIPIRLGTEWDDAVPGFVEIDLVAHCGATTAGDYVNTLSVTDVFSGWTETIAVLNKARVHVFGGLQAVQARQPFPYKGIDSDNGSEFINAHLYNWCKKNNICFTRSRPYKKNDNCHVEQKNWHVVRRNIGYNRYESQAATDAMNDYYALMRLYTNYFLPQTKLLDKMRVGARLRKRYDKPKTPYRRLLESGLLTPEAITVLQGAFASLNPAALKRDMVKALKVLEAFKV